MGVTGWCMGGSVAFLAAAYWELGAAVSFYGGGITQGRFGMPPLIDLAPTLQTPWLGLFGDHDAVDPHRRGRGAQGHRGREGQGADRVVRYGAPTTASTATRAPRTTRPRPPTAGPACSRSSASTSADPPPTTTHCARPAGRRRPRGGDAGGASRVRSRPPRTIRRAGSRGGRTTAGPSARSDAVGRARRLIASTDRVD